MSPSNPVDEQKTLDYDSSESTYCLYNEGEISMSEAQILVESMKPRFWTYILLLGSFFAFFLYFLVSLPAPNGKPVNAPSPCGTSPSEARDRGCHFDILHYSWLPSLCADEGLELEFLPINFMVSSADTASQNSAVSNEALKAGDVQTIVVTDVFLAKQCQYAWKKLRRTLTEKRMADSRIWDIEGMDRCADFLAGFPNGWEKRNQSDVRIKMDFLYCVEG